MSDASFYSTGSWQPFAGQEDAFLAAWTEFVELGRSAAGRRQARGDGSRPARPGALRQLHGVGEPRGDPGLEGAPRVQGADGAGAGSSSTCSRRPRPKSSHARVRRVSDERSILGGGFGGIAASVELKRLLGDEHEVVLVDRKPEFTMGLRKLWALVGHRHDCRGQQGSGAARASTGSRVVEEEILAIDPAARAAETTSGRLDGDHLVIALGAVSRPDLVPGLAEHGHDIWAFAGVPGRGRGARAIRRRPPPDPDRRRPVPVPAGAVRVRVPSARLSRTARPSRPDATLPSSPCSRC